MDICYIQFQNRITEWEVPFLRGVIISKYSDSTLLHNHIGSKFRYAYPLVQYKRFNGNAGIIGINEGAEELKQTSLSDFPCKLGNHQVSLKIKSVESESVNIDFADTPIYYRLSNWLPLNQRNYRVYQQQYFLTDRIKMLENVLVGNILSFTKGIGLHVRDQITCRIADIQSQKFVPFKDVDLMSFNIIFQSNIHLPKFIGLGKGASTNHGTIVPINV